MNATIVDVFIGILSVIAAPFLIQGIHNAKTAIGRWFQVFFGVGLVAVFMSVWGSTGHDPLQLGYCWFARSAKACRDIEWVSPVATMASSSAKDRSQIPGNQVIAMDAPITNAGDQSRISSTKSSDAAVQKKASPAVAADNPILTQRWPGALSSEWLKGKLYGSDNYVAALQRVTITSQGGTTYKAKILNQEDWTCDLLANERGDPGELRNCISASKNTYSDRSSIPLKCVTLKRERVCTGDFSLDSTYQYTDPQTGEQKNGVSKWPGTFTIAHH